MPPQVQDDVDEYLKRYTQQKVREEAQKQGVPVDYAERQAKAESAFRPDVITGRKQSSAGAIGAMQLMPGTAKDLGVNPYHIDQNIEGGVRYSKQMLDRYKGDQQKAAAAYNWGPGNVDRKGLANAPAETRAYQQKVAGTQGDDVDEFLSRWKEQPATKKEQLRQSVTSLQDELTATTPQVKPGNTLNVTTGRQYPTPPPPPFQSPIDMRLNAPNEAQKAYDRAAAAVQPAPQTPAPRPKQTLGQMRQQARTFQPVTQEDILRNPITPEERKASTEQHLAALAEEKRQRQAAARLKLEEEAGRASQSTLGRMGTRFARGAVRGTTQTPFEFVQMATTDPVVRQTMGRIADESKEWQSQNLPVDNRNPATLNVFKPEFYSLENVGKAATETIPEVLGEMLPQMALARGAGGVARLAAPELAAATVPRMASTTGAQLAARTAAGGYGAAQLSTQAYQKALDAGMTPEQAARAAAIEAPIGFSEFLGSPGTTGFTRPGTTIRREMREEGLQELGQTAASGLAGKYASGYDANKPLVDIAGESIGSGILGGVTGGIVATPGARLQARQQANQQRATRSAIDQRSAANAAAIAPQPAAAQPVTEPLTEPMAAQPQPSASATPQAQPTQPEGLPRLPARELSAQDKFAQVYGAKEPVENRINAMIGKAETLLGSQNENDRKMGERMMNRALTAIRQTEGYLAEAALPPDAPRPFTAVRDAIEARLSNTGRAKNTPSQVTTPESAQVQSQQQPTASNALRAEADAAKIKAAEFEQVGDFTQAAETYQAAHTNLKRLRRSMGMPKTPEAVAQINQIDREISIADANRRKAMQAARTAQRQANAPTKDLAIPATFSRPKSAQVQAQQQDARNISSDISAPLLRPDAVQNPEGGIPQMPEPTFTDRLEAAARRDASARGKAKPAKRLLSRIAELGGISDRYAGELQDVKDARRIGVIRQKAEMSPDVLARQLQSEGYDVDPEDLNTLWEAARRDIAGRDERTSQTSELERRLAEEEAAYNERQPFDQIVADVDAEPTNRLRDAEYEGGEMQRYSKPLEGQAAEKEDWELTREQWGRKETDILNASIDANERFNLSGMAQRRALARIDELINGTAHRRKVMAALREGKPVPAEVLADYPDLQPKQAFQPDTADLREVREFGKREPRTEQFTEEPPTAPLARRRQPIRPPAPASPRPVGNRPLSVDVAGTRTPTAMSPDFPRARREMIKQGREVEARLTEGQDKGVFGNVAEAMFKSNTPDVLHGQDSFFHDPDVKGKLGLTRDAEMADVRRELKTQLARSLGLSADEVSLSHIKPEVWRAWAKQKGLGREAVRKLEAGIARAERKQRATKTNAQIVAEESQRAKEELRQPAAKAEVKIGEYYTFTEPAIVYKNGQPVTIESKKRGRVIEILPDGSVSLKRQDGGYATKQVSDLTDASGNTPVAKTSTETQKAVKKAEPKPSQKEEVRNVGGRLTTEEGRRKVEEARQAMEDAIRRNDYTKPGERADAIAAARERVQEAQAEAHLEAARLRREKQQSAPPAKSIDAQIKDIRDLQKFDLIDDKEAKRQIAALEAQRPKIAERREAQPKTRADVENSPEFKRWFGDSKVVDESGKPLVVYHGSPSGMIDEFRVSRNSGMNQHDLGEGVYLTPSADEAAHYATGRGWGDNEKGTVYPVYVRLVKPFISEDPIPDDVLAAAQREAERIRAKETPTSREESFLEEVENITPETNMGDTLAFTENARRWRSLLISQGYDGGIENTGNKQIVAFEPSQIKSAIGNRGTFDPDSAKIAERREAPGFFSQLERVIDAKMPAKASAAQVRAIIENPQSGVKPEEVKWTGLDDYLRGKETVTKADVQEFLKANQVDVREVESGKKAYAQYTLPGAKEDSYRELLLTLPRKGPEVRRLGIDEWTIDGRPATREEALATSVERGYQSSHFDEPNILAHIRFNERTDADGKRVLHIEEIQSDWHQKGRKKGYGAQDGYVVKDSNGRLIARQPTREAAERIADDLRNGRTPAQQQRGEAGIPVTVESVKGDVQGVPDAPFKKTWHELAFKRALRWAAENGYERMTWTTGKQQAERFDLSKQVKEIEYIKRGNEYELGVTSINGDDVRLPKDRFTADELEDVVGKEIAQKIVNGEGRKYRGHDGYTLEGLDLKVGGEGMKGFYDSILPAFANKYGRKWGVKVGTAQVEVEGKSANSEIPDAENALIEQRRGKKYRIKTDPELRQQMNLIAAKLRADSEALPAFQSLSDDQKAKIRRIYTDAPEYVYFSDRGEAKKFSDETGLPIESLTDLRLEKTNTAAVHSIDITPAMRESVMQGQPKFRREVSGAMPERYTGRQLFENAQLTFRPARNRPATLVANDWGGAMLNQLLNDTFGITTTDANFTIAAKYAKDLRDYLADAKDSGIYEPAQVANMGAMLKQMDAAIADAEANQQDVAFVTRRPAEPISATKAKIRHETVHLSQSRIAADLSALTGKNWLDSQPNAADIHKELNRRGYAPETHDYEAAAFVASGDYGVFGMNLDQAAKFLSDYFGAVVQKHGKRALQKFGAIDPKLQPVLEAARRETGTTRSSTDGRTNETAPGTPRRIGAADEARGGRASVLARRREGDTGDAGEAGRSPRIAEQRQVGYKPGQSSGKNTYNVDVFVYDLKGARSRTKTVKVSADNRPEAMQRAEEQVARSYPAIKSTGTAGAKDLSGYTVKALSAEKELGANRYREAVANRRLVRQATQVATEKINKLPFSKAEAELQAAYRDAKESGESDDVLDALFQAYRAMHGQKPGSSVIRAISESEDAVSYLEGEIGDALRLIPDAPDPSPRITERKERPRFSFGRVPEGQGQVLASFPANLQSWLGKSKPKEADTPAKPEPVPADWDQQKWAKKAMDALVTRDMPKEDREKFFDFSTKKPERLALLQKYMPSEKDIDALAGVIDRANNALKNNDGDDLREAVWAARAIAERPATNAEKASALMRAAMFSTPRGRMRDLISNFAEQKLATVARIPGSAADAAFTTLRRMLTGEGERTFLGPRPAEYLKNRAADRAKQWKQTKDVWQGKHVDALEDVLQHREVNFDNKFLDKTTKAVFRAMGAADQWFFVKEYQRAIREQAELAARADVRSGVITKADRQKQTDYYAAAPTTEMKAMAELAAKQMVFRNPNFLSDKVFKPLRENLPPGANFALDIVMPVDRTPTNIILTALEYSPLGAVKLAGQMATGTVKATAKTLRNRKDLPTRQAIKKALDEAFPPEKQRAMSRLFGRTVTGTSAPVALGFALASAGLATGFYDEDDPGEEAERREEGKMPNSVKIGGRWYELGGIAPLGMLIGLGATLHREMHAETLDPEKRYARLAKGFGNMAMELPALESAKQTVKIAKAATGKPSDLGRIAGNIGARFVPGLVSDIGQATPYLRDPYEREIKAPKSGEKDTASLATKAGREFAGEFGARIPGVRRLLPPKMNTLTGKPVETEWHDVIDPFRSRKAVEPGSLSGVKAAQMKFDISSEVRPKIGEPDEVFQQRKQRVEGWMSEYGDKLLSHPSYSLLTESQKQAAIENLRRRIGTQQNATRPRLDSLAPEKVIQSVLKSEATRPKREAGKLWSPLANRP